MDSIDIREIDAPPRRRRLRARREDPSDQIGIRAPIAAINEFIGFCEAHRYTYGEGLEAILDLARQARETKE